jgi:hypothetical protein
MAKKKTTKKKPAKKPTTEVVDLDNNRAKADKNDDPLKDIGQEPFEDVLGTRQTPPIRWVSVSDAARKCNLNSAKDLFYKAIRGEIQICAVAKNWQITWGHIYHVPSGEPVVVNLGEYDEERIEPGKKPVFLESPYPPEWLENMLVALRPVDLSECVSDENNAVHIKWVRRLGRFEYSDGEISSPKKVLIKKLSLVVTEKEVQRYLEVHKLRCPVDEYPDELKQIFDENNKNHATELEAVVRLWLEFWADPDKHPRYNEQEQHTWLEREYPKECQDKGTRARLIVTAKPDWKKRGGSNKTD